MSNITFAPFPIPVVVEGIGDCYIVSQTNSGTFEDDLFVVAKCDGGQMFHVRTSQMKMHYNATIGINAKHQESYTQEWLREFYKGVPIPWKETRGWDDSLVAEFAGLISGKIMSGKKIIISSVIKDFKEKNNIK